MGQDKAGTQTGALCLGRRGNMEVQGKGLPMKQTWLTLLGNVDKETRRIWLFKDEGKQSC